MKLQALSYYQGDTKTRFGDCILVSDGKSLTIFDCGHNRHAEEVIGKLKSTSAITKVNIVVSHNDSDHTAGVCHLLDWLNEQGRYTVTIYTHQYLKHVDEILYKIDDGRRTRKSMEQALLDEFDNIQTIIEAAERYGFTTTEALKGIAVGTCTIVGPTTDQFIEVAAQAVDSRVSDAVAGEHTEETVMNAASIQLSGKLDDGQKFLLCGDAHPDYLECLGSYDVIQLPHHGQMADAQAVFKKLRDQQSDSYSKVFLISDNTGDGENSGGSDELVQWMKTRNYSLPKNTKNGVVRLPDTTASGVVSKPQGVRLGGLDRWH